MILFVFFYWDRIRVVWEGERATSQLGRMSWRNYCKQDKMFSLMLSVVLTLPRFIVFNILFESFPPLPPLKLVKLSFQSNSNKCVWKKHPLAKLHYWHVEYYWWCSPNVILVIMVPQDIKCMYILLFSDD